MSIVQFRTEEEMDDAFEEDNMQRIPDHASLREKWSSAKECMALAEDELLEAEDRLKEVEEQLQQLERTDD